ncbi:MAG: 2,3-butanediol dehydrogenase [Chloroflexi bacterium]|nr:2,3-butanediol dehydrogenase [Chloroflexota bacterium]
MKAAVWHGPRDVRVEDVPEPGAPGPGMVTVRVAWCGICGSDLQEYLAGPIFIPTRPHRLTGRVPPITLGHEFSGEVVALGEGVEQIVPGDRVTADACWYCGICPWCRRGQYNLCKSLGSTGLCADGAFARYVVVPAYTVFRLPEGLSYEIAALAEPTAVAVHAVKRGQVQVGDTVCVFGAGPVGLLTLQAARAAGAARVYVVELADARKQLALALGAESVLDPREGEVVKRLFRLTDGIGVDVSFECIGGAETAPQAIEAARRGGRAVMAGIFHEQTSLHFNRVVMFEKEVVGSIGYAGEFRAALPLLADGRILAEPLITARIALADFVEEGLTRLMSERDRQVKILVNPSGAC